MRLNTYAFQQEQGFPRQEHQTIMCLVSVSMCFPMAALQIREASEIPCVCMCAQTTASSCSKQEDRGHVMSELP